MPAVYPPYMPRITDSLLSSFSNSRAVGALNERRQDARTQPAGGKSAAFLTALLVRLPPERVSRLSHSVRPFTDARLLPFCRFAVLPHLKSSFKQPPFSSRISDASPWVCPIVEQQRSRHGNETCDGARKQFGGLCAKHQGGIVRVGSSTPVTTTPCLSPSSPITPPPSCEHPIFPAT